MALVWCWHYDRWTVAQWQLPTSYSGDSHEILARLKAASEGDILPGRPQVISRLGAPFGAHWNAYPTPDKLLMLALGGLTKVAGLFVAANVGLLLAQISAALSFFLVTRWLRVRWEWAIAGALWFAYSYGTFYRGLAHFSLLFSWTVPLGLCAVWLVAGSRRLAWRRPGAWVCLGAAVALGAHNPYNLYFWLQLMGWALIAQWFRARRRPNLQIGLTAIGLSLAVFVVMHLEVWAHVEEPAGSPLLERNYGGTERYALKPVELLIPPSTHRWPALAFLGQRYARWSDWRGEAFPPYLGVVGIAGLIWLGALTARRLFRRRPVPEQALSLAWLAAFSSVGGVTNVLAFFIGLQVFRATNRVGIYLSAIILFFVVVRLSRITARWPRSVGVAAAAALAVFGILDQVPRGPTAAQTQEIASAVAADAELGRELEASLPDGAMIFQLPVQGFPEVVPPWKLTDYELFRPYLATSTLRFSYGAAKFRARSRWQRDLEKESPSELVRRLEAYGFSALFLNRKGYEDQADTILGELQALGYTHRIQSQRANQVVVLLHPMSPPSPPLAQAFTYGLGWHLAPVDGIRWAFGDAVISYYNPFDKPLVMDLKLSLVAASPRTLTLTHEGRAVGGAHVDREKQELRVVGLSLHPGVNRFRLESNQPAYRAGTGRYQLRSFGLATAWLQTYPTSAPPALAGD